MFLNILKNVFEHTQIFKNIPETLKNIPEHFKTFRNILKHLEIF